MKQVRIECRVPLDSKGNIAHLPLFGSHSQIDGEQGNEGSQ